MVGRQRGFADVTRLCGPGHDVRGIENDAPEAARQGFHFLWVDAMCEKQQGLYLNLGRGSGPWHKGESLACGKNMRGDRQKG